MKNLGQKPHGNLAAGGNINDVDIGRTRDLIEIQRGPAARLLDEGGLLAGLLISVHEPPDVFGARRIGDRATYRRRVGLGLQITEQTSEIRQPGDPVFRKIEISGQTIVVDTVNTHQFRQPLIVGTGNRHLIGDRH